MKTKNPKSVKLLLSTLLLISLLSLIVFTLNASEKTSRQVRVVSLCFQAGYDFPEILKIVDQEGAEGTDNQHILQGLPGL
jgi:hypothetical protein